MKSNPTKKVISKLNRIKEELEFLTHPDSRTTFRKDLDELIVALNRLRAGLADQSLHTKAGEVRQPLLQVIEFLEFAQSNETLTALLLPIRKAATPKPKRQAIEIAVNLTNEEIRALLEKSLSKAELKAIAAQRAISVGKSNNEQIKRDILKNLERQEGYGRLAAI